MAAPRLRMRHAGQEAIVTGDDVAVIGSGDGATLTVRRPGISRRHAEVRYTDTHWVVRDTESLNGTFTDGRRVDVMQIDKAVTLRLGHPDEGEVVELEPLGDGAPPEATQLIDTPGAAPSAPGRDTMERVILALWAIAGAIVFLGAAIIIAAVIS